MPDRQIDRVFAAVRAGARTSNAVAAATGLSIRCCSSWLYELKRRGLVVKVGMVRVKKMGQGSGEYEVKET